MLDFEIPEFTTVLATSATAFAMDLAAEDTTPNLLTTPLAAMILGLIIDVASLVIRLIVGGLGGPINRSPFDEAALEGLLLFILGTLALGIPEFLSNIEAHEERCIS